MKPELFAAYKWVKDIHFTSADKGDGLKGLHDSIVTHVLQKHLGYLMQELFSLIRVYLFFAVYELAFVAWH